MLEGSCLCGGVRFTITGLHSGVGFCHCSLCRKVSGAAATAIVVLDFDQLIWRSGEALVRRFERPSGYGSAFCQTCGSPAPDHDRARTVWCVPAGLLDGDPALAIADHSYVASRARWDVIGNDDAPRFDGDGPPRLRDHRAGEPCLD